MPLVELEGLRLPDSPLDVRSPQQVGVALPDRDHVGFLVNGPHISEPRPQPECDLPGAAGKVERVLLCPPSILPLRSSSRSHGYVGRNTS